MSSFRGSNLGFRPRGVREVEGKGRGGKWRAGQMGEERKGSRLPTCYVSQTDVLILIHTIAKYETILPRKREALTTINKHQRAQEVSRIGGGKRISFSENYQSSSSLCRHVYTIIT